MLPLLMMWAGLGATWLALGGSAWFQRRGGVGEGPSWFARNQAWVTSLLGAMVAALAGYSAWSAAQSQITAMNETTRRQIAVIEDTTGRQITANVETTKLQVAAALATTKEQIDEGRREHRLEYLCQRLSQVDAAVDWLAKARNARWRITWPVPDGDPWPSRRVDELKEYIALLDAMPTMPFTSKDRPPSRRDSIEEAARRYQEHLLEHDSGDNGRRRKRTEAARKELTEAADWTEVEQVASSTEFDIRREIEALERETALQPADRP